MDKIGFIGAGNMAEALIKGILRAQVVASKDVIMADVNQERLTELGETYGVLAAGNNREVVTRAGVIILAVKPQVLPGVLGEIAEVVNKDKLFISIAAGVTLSLLRAKLGDEARLIRVMPNTPALVLEAMSAVCSDGVSEADMEVAKRIFSSIGQVTVVGENLIDVITGLSGSGPAYVAVMIDALADGGVLMGLPKKISQELALQTVLGTARLLQDTKGHPALLKDMVSSPGGTTIQGIFALEKGGVRASLMEAVKSATLRSQELGGKVCLRRDD